SSEYSKKIPEYTFGIFRRNIPSAANLRRVFRRVKIPGQRIGQRSTDRSTEPVTPGPAGLKRLKQHPLAPHARELHSPAFFFFKLSPILPPPIQLLPAPFSGNFGLPSFFSTSPILRYPTRSPELLFSGQTSLSLSTHHPWQNPLFRPPF